MQTCSGLVKNDDSKQTVIALSNARRLDSQVLEHALNPESSHGVRITPKMGPCLAKPSEHPDNKDR